MALVHASSYKCYRLDEKFPVNVAVVECVIKFFLSLKSL